jgi:2,4-dienoyl-CoA reductase-like NADH-dependent reductase (Old Yellow Enzyme family)/thioredoxin reductase
MQCYQQLFSPVRVGTMTLKNRIVMPAMETHLGDHEGFVTGEVISYYRHRARGGAALLIFENTGVHLSGRVNKGMVCIYDDKYIPGFKKLTDAVHAEGGKIAIQLSHAGRQTLSDFTGSQPVAPSPIPCPVLREEPRELTASDISELVEAFARGALRAQQAGADAVEIHMAHGYLVTQFLSPYSNQRTDRYGGSTENRCRFSVEILKRTRELVGTEFPVLCRISADEYVAGGLEINEAKKIAVILEKNGADAINVSACNYESSYLNMPAYYRQEGCFVHLAREVKKCVSVPVGTVGRIRRAAMAEEILQRGDADLICMGRVLIADPYLPRKVEKGEEDDIRVCLSCNRCIESIASGKIVCAVNPDLGKEDSSGGTPASAKKKVLIVGGGPAGMQAAVIAAQRGHEVTLIDREGELGGQLFAAGAPPCKEPIIEFKEYLEREVRKHRMQVELGKEITAQDILSRRPDAVVIAAGCIHLFPEIPGVREANAYTVKDAFRNVEKLGNKVAVIGGGPEGAELADFLVEKGKKVSVVEMRRLVGLGLPSGVRQLLETRLKDRGVECILRAKVVEFQKKAVIIEDKKTGKRALEGFDSIVVAILHKNNDLLFKELEGKVTELFIIGDAKEPRLIKEAVAEGDAVARTL